MTRTARGLEFQDPASGRVLRTLAGIDQASYYSFSRDGRFVPAGAAGKLRLWDAASGRFVRSIGPLVWPTILKTIRERVLWGVAILVLWVTRLTRLWKMAPAATKIAAKGGPGILMTSHLRAVAGITAAVLCYEMAEYVRPGRGHDDWGPFFDVLFFGSLAVALLLNSVILELVWWRVQSKTARASAALFVVLNAVGALRCFVAVPRSLEALVFPTPIGVVLVLLPVSTGPPG